MDTIPSNQINPLVSTTTPVFGDNVQDLLNGGLLNLNPTGIIVVNSIDDVIGQPGGTTLRDAINQANADPGEDLIVFDRSLFSNAQTITLKLGELDITHSLDIIAPTDSLTGTDLVTVSGNKASRVFEIGTGTTVSLDALIVADGKATDNNGGGILNSGSLTLENSIVRNNSATILNAFNLSIGGGGIYNSGTISLSNSTVSGNSASGLFGRGNGGGISNDGTATLSNSTISGNRGESANGGNGGGISNAGNLTLSNSTITGNKATGGYRNNNSGGGIYSTSTLEVSNSTISDNSCDDPSNTSQGGGIDIVRGISTVSNSTISGNTAFYGGGIFNGGTTTLSNSTLLDNKAVGNNVAINSPGNGGGIYNGATLTVSNSTISGNSASGGDTRVRSSGGGIYNGSTLTVSNSTISGNTADNGGGIYTSGISTVTNSTISGNSPLFFGFSVNSSGGGIFNSGTSTVSNSTISGNTATQGGGIANFGGNVTLSNSTLLDNEAVDAMLPTNLPGVGGGIYNDYSGTITLLFSTVTQNIATNGGGVYQNDVPSTSTSVSGSFNVRNTIIAANLNSANGVNPDVSGTFTSNGYNLIGDGTGSTGFGQVRGDIVGTSDTPIDPRLAPLDFYGGPTQTIALLADSPAIGAADPIVLDTDPTTDQRGLPRRAADGSADIGAFQFS